MKNIVSGIVSYSELLMSEKITDPFVDEGVHEIHDAGERALSMLQQIHRLSQPDCNAKSEIDLVELIDSNIKTFYTLTQTRINWKRPEATIEIQGNELQLFQAVLNLVVNAAQAMVPEQNDKAVTLQLVQHKEGQQTHCSIQVSDNGKGMDSATIEKIFKRNFTTKANSGGTGIGLSTVQTIIADHGGTIDVSSELGRGTTFSLNLPTCEQSLATA